LEVHLEAFQWVLDVAQTKGLLRGKVLAVDATTLEANAAMKSMVRRVSGEKWAAYLRRLAKAEGLENPTDEDLRRFDRKRKDKKVSNAEWASPVDPDSRIMKMKDGRTRFTPTTIWEAKLEEVSQIRHRVAHFRRGHRDDLQRVLQLMRDLDQGFWRFCTSYNDPTPVLPQSDDPVVSHFLHLDLMPWTQVSDGKWARGWLRRGAADSAGVVRPSPAADPAGGRRWPRGCSSRPPLRHVLETLKANAGGERGIGWLRCFPST
jgi:hypothetical protein